LTERVRGAEVGSFGLLPGQRVVACSTGPPQKQPSARRHDDRGEEEDGEPGEDPALSVQPDHDFASSAVRLASVLRSASSRSSSTFEWSVNDMDAAIAGWTSPISRCMSWATRR